VLDNASIHSCKYIKKFIAKSPEVKVFNLPTCSPEYNSTEQVWKRIKPLVHAARKNEKGC
jgi:transposase